MTVEYQRSDRYVYRHVAGEHLLISLQRTTVTPMCTLTVTGAEVWIGLADWMTRDALVDMLTAAFEVDRVQADDDVDEFLRQLGDMNALNTREADSR